MVIGAGEDPCWLKLTGYKIGMSAVFLDISETGTCLLEVYDPPNGPLGKTPGTTNGQSTLIIKHFLVLHHNKVFQVVQETQP